MCGGRSALFSLIPDYRIHIIIYRSSKNIQRVCNTVSRISELTSKITCQIANSASVANGNASLHAGRGGRPVLAAPHE